MEILQTRRFQKALEAMRGAGKNERAAFRRAEKIIADLQNDPLHVEAASKRTRHGELRLQQCRKYDLACGYRLIALKRDGRLIFVYVGSHDDCQRWIENNREHQDELEAFAVPLRKSRQGKLAEEPFPQAKPDIDEYEEQLLAKVDDKLLQEIFCGLVH